MDIEILADKWEKEQKIINELYAKLVENGEEFRIFNPNVNDELPF